MIFCIFWIAPDHIDGLASKVISAAMKTNEVNDVRRFLVTSVKFRAQSPGGEGR